MSNPFRDQRRALSADRARLRFLVRSCSSLLPDRIDALVLNERVAVHRLGQRDEFWYRRATAAGHEFVIVDAASGRKRPAFDHRALAAAREKSHV